MTSGDALWNILLPVKSDTLAIDSRVPWLTERGSTLNAALRSAVAASDENARGPVARHIHATRGSLLAVIPGDWGIRLDVDDADALARAVDRGVGRHTAALHGLIRAAA